jgi:hypothetical protein
MRYLTLGEVVALHRAILDATGGADGIRDLGALGTRRAPDPPADASPVAVLLAARTGWAVG